MKGHPDNLHARVRAIRSRTAMRRWEMRHRRFASGAWFRLGRLLTLTSRAWILSERDIETLVEAGYQPHPAGHGLEPPRNLFVVPKEQIASLADGREIALQSSPHLLLARNLALIPFDDIDPDEL